MFPEITIDPFHEHSFYSRFVVIFIPRSLSQLFDMTDTLLSPKYLFASAKDAVTVNNQDSSTMKLRVEDMVFVLHDNRIYAFYSRAEAIVADKSSSSSSSPEQNILLNMLTTPYFRALSMIYILFRIFDNTALVVIVVISIIENKLAIPSSSTIALFGTVGLELFYDVMLNVNKYWPLQRLSFFIGLVLYFMYFTIVLTKHATGELSNRELHITAIVLAVRFVTFLFEEMVDVAIDCCLHNALNSIQKIQFDPEVKPTAQTRELSTLPQQQTDVITTPFIGVGQVLVSLGEKLRLLEVTLPAGIEYKGSFFAWGTTSVYDIGQDGEGLETGYFDWHLICALLAIPSVCTGILALIIAALVACAAALAMMITSVYYLIVWLISGQSKTTKFSNYVKELKSI